MQKKFITGVKSRISIIILGLFFVSCASRNDQPKIRIVDLQGKPKPVVTKIPELNASAIASQNLARDQRNFSQPNSSQTNLSQENQASVTPQSQKQNLANANDFGSVSSQAIQQTLQSEQKDKKSEDGNPIVNGGTPENEERPIEYDLSEEAGSGKKSEKVEKPAVKKSVKNSHKKSSGKTKYEASGTKKFFVQVGSFANRGNAESALGRMKKFHPGKIETLEGEKIVYRVLLGPFPNKTKANILVAKIKKSGNEAILVRSK